MEATEETNALAVKPEDNDGCQEWSQDAQPPEQCPMSLGADSFPETQQDGVPPDEGQDEGSSRSSIVQNNPARGPLLLTACNCRCAHAGMAPTCLGQPHKEAKNSAVGSAGPASTQCDDEDSLPPAKASIQPPEPSEASLSPQKAVQTLAVAAESSAVPEPGLSNPAAKPDPAKPRDCPPKVSTPTRAPSTGAEPDPLKASTPTKAPSSPGAGTPGVKPIPQVLPGTDAPPTEAPSSPSAGTPSVKPNPQVLPDPAKCTPTEVSSPGAGTPVVKKIPEPLLSTGAQPEPAKCPFLASTPTEAPSSPGAGTPSVKPNPQVLPSSAKFTPTETEVSSPGAGTSSVKPNQEAPGVTGVQATEGQNGSVAPAPAAESKAAPKSPVDAHKGAETPVASITSTSTPTSTPRSRPHQAAVATQDAPGGIDEQQEPSSYPPEQLSVGAIDKRLRRVMAPRANGEYLVSQDFVKMWNDKLVGRDKVRALFEKAAYCPETNLH